LPAIYRSVNLPQVKNHWTRL